MTVGKVFPFINRGTGSEGLVGGASGALGTDEGFYLQNILLSHTEAHTMYIRIYI